MSYEMLVWFFDAEFFTIFFFVFGFGGVMAYIFLGMIKAKWQCESVITESKGREKYSWEEKKDNDNDSGPMPPIVFPW